MSSRNVSRLLPLALTALGLGCSPAVMVPPVLEPLDSVAWKDCAKEATDREASSLIDDLTMDSKTLLCKGVVMAEDNKRVDEALELLAEAAIRDKEDHRAYYLSGRILVREGRHEEALTAFARANKRYGEMEVPSERLGRMVLERSGPGEATRFLEKALERDLCLYGCRGLLAKLYHQGGKSDEAKRIYKEMLEREPQEPAAYVGLAGISNTDGDFDSEALLLAKATETDGFRALTKEEQARTHYSRAFAYYNGGNYKEAKDSLDVALQMDEKPDWWLLAGWIHRKMEDPAMAAIKFEKAAELDPKLSLAYEGNADCQLTLGKIDDAIELYKKAAFLDPTNPVSKLKLARAYVAKKDMDKARIQLEDAIKIDKDRLPPGILEEVTSAMESAKGGGKE